MSSRPRTPSLKAARRRAASIYSSPPKSQIRNRHSSLDESTDAITFLPASSSPIRDGHAALDILTDAINFLPSSSPSSTTDAIAFPPAETIRERCPASPPAASIRKRHQPLANSTGAIASRTAFLPARPPSPPSQHTLSSTGATRDPSAPEYMYSLSAPPKYAPFPYTHPTKTALIHRPYTPGAPSTYDSKDTTEATGAQQAQEKGEAAAVPVNPEITVRETQTAAEAQEEYSETMRRTAIWEFLEKLDQGQLVAMEFPLRVVSTTHCKHTLGAEESPERIRKAILERLEELDEGQLVAMGFPPRVVQGWLSNWEREVNERLNALKCT